MDRLVFTSLGSITNQTHVRAHITNNLANVSTVGFKQSFAVASESVNVEGQGFATRTSFKTTGQDVINLKPGISNRTGRAMDVALQDSTVLGVQGKDGDVAFTRRGDLRVSPLGLIENSAGHLILGENGPINVPPGQMVTISADGSVFGTLPGSPDLPPVLLVLVPPTRAILLTDSLNEKTFFIKIHTPGSPSLLGMTLYFSIRAAELSLNSGLKNAFEHSCKHTASGDSSKILLVAMVYLCLVMSVLSNGLSPFPTEPGE